MRQGYITYYEGYDVQGKLVIMGNHSAHVDYTDYVDENKFLISISEHLNETLKKENSLVSTVIIKGIFKL